jgi:hypothetical protein
MRKPQLIGLSGLVAALLLVGASSLHAGATLHATFGAKLTSMSEPANAEGGQRCDANSGIPTGAACTWVSVDAYQNAGHERAPSTGTIAKLRLVSCVAGSFRLQFARVKLASQQARVVRDGPLIKYKADPRQVDGDPNTVCGGDNGDNFIIQTFSVNVHVNKGDYIAIKTTKTGTLYCSGGSGVLLFSPTLAAGKGYRAANTDASCNLLVQLEYKFG